MSSSTHASQRGNPSTGTASTSTSTANPPAATAKSYFETQRAALVGEIAVSFEHVLTNINKLNRSLEEVIVLGNEFSSVEALWSQFENVMAKDPDADEGQGQGQSQAQAQSDEGRKGSAPRRDTASSQDGG